jgi:hypothetical protein
MKVLLKQNDVEDMTFADAYLYTAKSYAILARSLSSLYYLNKAKAQVKMYYKEIAQVNKKNTFEEEETITIVYKKAG